MAQQIKGPFNGNSWLIYWSRDLNLLQSSLIQFANLFPIDYAKERFCVLQTLVLITEHYCIERNIFVLLNDRVMKLERIERIKAFKLIDKLKEKELSRQEAIETVHTVSGVPKATAYEWWRGIQSPLKGKKKENRKNLPRQDEHKLRTVRTNKETNEKKFGNKYILLNTT
jgi:hypothetical protein